MFGSLFFIQLLRALLINYSVLSSIASTTLLGHYPINHILDSLVLVLLLLIGNIITEIFNLSMKLIFFVFTLLKYGTNKVKIPNFLKMLTRIKNIRLITSILFLILTTTIIPSEAAVVFAFIDLLIIQSRAVQKRVCYSNNLRGLLNSLV